MSYLLHMKEGINMADEIGTNNVSKIAKTKAACRRSVSVFWIIVGGLLLFVGVASILHRAGILSQVGAEYVEDGLLVFIGAIIVYYALRG